MGTYAYDAANDTLSLVAGTGDTDALAAKLTKTSNNIAPLQSGSTASSLIPVGEYFINSNGDLCQCDVQINADSAIVIGTNCHVIQDGGVNDLNGKIHEEYSIYCEMFNVDGILSPINNKANITFTDWGTGTANNALRIRLHQKGNLDYFTIKINALRSNIVNGNDYTICTMLVSPTYFNQFSWYGKKSICTANDSKIVLACNYTQPDTATDYLDVLLIGYIMAEVEVRAYAYQTMTDPIKTNRIVPSECCGLTTIPSSSSYNKWVETVDH